MIEKIYGSLLRLFRAVKKPFGAWFGILFIGSFITMVADITPDWLWILWVITGGLMVSFAFITGIFHLLLGNKLKREGKLDEEGNYREDILDSP